LRNNNVTTLQHPPYSPNLPPADFYLFLRLKSKLKRRHFCDGTDIIKNATKELKRLSQNGLPKTFPTYLQQKAELKNCTRELFLKEMWVKSLYSFVFLRYKVVWVTI
jgi:hypothetical protein